MPGTMATVPTDVIAARPSPDAQAVSRPRIGALLVWLAMLAVGAVGLTGSGVSAGVAIVGAFFVVVGGFGLVAWARTRVWVEGPVLYARSVFGWAPPLRLDRLVWAWLSPFGRNSGRQLHLADADGNRVQLDATNHRLARLYEVLAGHIAHGDPLANELLHKRMDATRPGLPFGPG